MAVHDPDAKRRGKNWNLLKDGTLRTYLYQVNELDGAKWKPIDLDFIPGSYGEDFDLRQACRDREILLSSSERKQRFTLKGLYVDSLVMDLVVTSGDDMQTHLPLGDAGLEVAEGEELTADYPLVKLLYSNHWTGIKLSCSIKEMAKPMLEGLATEYDGFGFGFQMVLPEEARVVFGGKEIKDGVTYQGEGEELWIEFRDERLVIPPAEVSLDETGGLGGCNDLRSHVRCVTWVRKTEELIRFAIVLPLAYLSRYAFPIEMDPSLTIYSDASKDGNISYSQFGVPQKVANTSLPWAYMGTENCGGVEGWHYNRAYFSFDTERLFHVVTTTPSLHVYCAKAEAPGECGDHDVSCEVYSSYDGIGAALDIGDWGCGDTYEGTWSNAVLLLLTWMSMNLAKSSINLQGWTDFECIAAEEAMSDVGAQFRLRTSDSVSDPYLSYTARPMPLGCIRRGHNVGAERVVSAIHRTL